MRLNNHYLLEANNISYSYGNKQVLFDVDMKLGQGEYLSIIGPNGSGKTTLFRTLCGQRNPQSGQVRFEGVDIANMSILQCAQNFSVLGQNEDTNFPFTCLDMVALGLHPFRSRFGSLSKEQIKTLLEIMEAMDVLHLQNQVVTQISGGELQRVMISRAIAQKPKILFLDEAMSELDIRAKIEIVKHLKELCQKQNMSVIAINHDLPSAWRHSDSIVALKGGCAMEKGTPKTVMSTEFFANTFGVEAEIIEEKGFIIHDSIKRG